MRLQIRSQLPLQLTLRYVVQLKPICPLTSEDLLHPSISGGYLCNESLTKSYSRG